MIDSVKTAATRNAQITVLDAEKFGLVLSCTSSVVNISMIFRAVFQHFSNISMFWPQDAQALCSRWTPVPRFALSDTVSIKYLRCTDNMMNMIWSSMCLWLFMYSCKYVFSYLKYWSSAGAIGTWDLLKSGLQTQQEQMTQPSVNWQEGLSSHPGFVMFQYVSIECTWTCIIQ